MQMLQAAWLVCRCQSLEASSSSDSATAAAQLQEQMQKAAQEAEQAQGKLDSSQSLLAQREAALKDARQELSRVQVCPSNPLHPKA